MKNLGLIISQTKRSLSYLKILRKINIKLDVIIVYGNKIESLKKYNSFKSKIYYFKGKKISKLISNKILNLTTKNFIVSLYPGEIIKDKNLLKKKSLFHVHSGKLPEYKGSTIIYYSILNKKKIYCSVIKLSKNLDQGKVFFHKSFKAPANLNESSYNSFDNKIRSHTLKSFISKAPKLIKQKKSKHFENYFVIHPILRKIALDKKFKKKLSKYIKKNYIN